MVSWVYARPFDRMPVEVTHLHRSLEGVTPTEVITGSYLLCRAEVQALQLLSCICTCRYIEKASLLNFFSKPGRSLLGSAIQKCSLPPCVLEGYTHSTPYGVTTMCECLNGKHIKLRRPLPERHKTLAETKQNKTHETSTRNARQAPKPSWPASRAGSRG